MSTISSSSPSSSSSPFYYVFAYDSSISNENNEIERVVHFYPEETSERIQCETSAFLCGLDAFMSTFLTSEDDENEEEEEDDDEKEEDEKTTTEKKGSSSSDSSFIGAKTRGKFYCAVNVLSSVWLAVVEVSVDSSSSRRHPLEMEQQQQHHQQQGNERLRVLRDVMEREVKEKLFVNDDTAPLVAVADAERRRRGTSSGSEEEEKRKWKEELKRLIDRLGERLNDESSSSSFAMGGAMMKTSSVTETKEDEDVAYVLEERENRSGCFVQTSASKSLDALSLISKREATKLRDEMESVLEEDESGSSATRTSTTIERATRPGHDAWLWSRVIADRTKRLFFITEREDVKTLLQANDAVNELGAA